MRPTDDYEKSLSQAFCEAQVQRMCAHERQTWWANEKPWKVYNATTNKHLQKHANKLRRRFAKDDIREQLRTLEL